MMLTLIVFKQLSNQPSQPSTIARSLGLYALEKPTKLQIADVFTVRVRRERPARKADKGSLYRSSQEFVKYILSQPVRLRIVGEPGAGKTPTVAVLLGHILSRGFLEANTPEALPEHGSTVGSLLVLPACNGQSLVSRSPVGEYC
jgi:hypothetical protein